MRDLVIGDILPKLWRLPTDLGRLWMGDWMLRRGKVELRAAAPWGALGLYGEPHARQLLESPTTPLAHIDDLDAQRATLTTATHLATRRVRQLPDELERSRTGDELELAWWAWRQLISLGWRARLVVGIRRCGARPERGWWVLARSPDDVAWRAYDPTSRSASGWMPPREAATTLFPDLSLDELCCGTRHLDAHMVHLDRQATRAGKREHFSRQHPDWAARLIRIAATSHLYLPPAGSAPSRTITQALTGAPRRRRQTLTGL